MAHNVRVESRVQKLEVTSAGFAPAASERYVLTATLVKLQEEEAKTLAFFANCRSRGPGGC
jgi:hypothetical protein